MGVGSELAQGLWKGFVKGAKGAVKTGADELFEKALKDGSAQKVFNTFPEEDLFNWKPLIESQNPEALGDLKSGLGNAAINENYQELLNVNTRLKEINDSMPSDAKVKPEAPVEDFTVAEELRAEGAKNLSPEDFQFQWNNVLKAWDEAAGLKSDSKDLLSRQATLGPVNSTQVKGWVSAAMAKMKSGLKREGGSGTYLDKKGYPQPTIEDMPFFELHHELMKAIYSAYMLQVKALYEARKITKLDVINFNHLAHEAGGFGMGDYGVVGYPRAVHQRGHSVLRTEGIEPTGNVLESKVEAITNFDNINDLTVDFKKSIQEISLPMRRQLNLSQRAYDSIPVWDQQKIFQLFRKKDNLKKDLKNSVLLDFEASGIKPPAKGGGEDLLKALRKKKGEPSQQTLEIETQVEEARIVAKNYLEEVKGRIAKQEGKDIQADIRRHDMQLDNLEVSSTDELQRGSYIESVEGTPLRGKFAEAAPKTTEAAQENIRMIRELVKKKGSLTEKDLNKLLNQRAKGK